MDFGTLLKNTLNNNNIPVSRFTEDIGFNRVAIYSVFNNKKKLSDETFEKILNTYNFSKQEKLNLFRTFRLSKFDRERFETMEFIKTEIERLGKAPDCCPSKTKKLDFSKTSVLLSSRADYNTAVEMLLRTENAFQNSVVYTNYSYSDEQIDKVVYDFVKSPGCTLSVRHSIRKGTKDNIKERLRNGFASVKFAKLGHMTSIELSYESPFAISTHFIGRNAVVMFDTKVKSGFYSTEETIVKAYHLSVAKREESRPLLNRVFNSAFDMKNFTEPLLSGNEQVVFKNHLPVRYFMQEDILDNMLKSDLDRREVLFRSFWNHASFCRSLNIPSAFTQCSIRRFLEDGKVYEAPDALFNRVSIADRKRILTEIRDKLLSDDSNFFVIRDASFYISEIITVICTASGASMFYILDKPGCDFLGTGHFTVFGEEFSDLLWDFYDYLFVKGFFLSNEEVKSEFDKAIAQCE